MKAGFKLNKATIITLIAVLTVAAVSLTLCVIMALQSGTTKTALIFEDGELLRSIPLNGGKTEYTIELPHNTVMVKNDSVAIIRADCPDQICVHTGFIHDGTIPIICMPNKIQIIIR
jgi:hypothetical protein